MYGGEEEGYCIKAIGYTCSTYCLYDVDFCFMVAQQFLRSLHCSWILVVVACAWIFHVKEGTI